MGEVSAIVRGSELIIVRRSQWPVARSR
jgi:hypothetical protein